MTATVAVEKGRSLKELSTDPRWRPGERGWDGNSYWQTDTSDETRVCHSFLAAGPARPDTVVHVTVETEEIEAPLTGGGDAHACVFASTLVGASSLILEPAPTDVAVTAIGEYHAFYGSAQKAAFDATSRLIALSRGSPRNA